MEKRILFISSFAESFLITALAKTLENGGYEVVFSQPYPKEIAEMKNRPPISILYLDNDATAYVSTLEYYAERLSHQTIDDPVYFFLIGNTVELDIAYRSLPKSLISAVFKRPVNTTDLITQLDLISTGYNYEAELPGVIKPNAGGPEDSSKKKILLVDDDSALLRSMQTLLGNKYNVYITNSGMNTITFLKNHTVDLILLDYEMPILSGQEVFRILKSEQATMNIPVIFLTSKDDKNIVKKVLELKPANYLLKPVSPAVLNQTLDEFFKEQEQEAERKKKQAEADQYLEELESADE